MKSLKILIAGTFIFCFALDSAAQTVVPVVSRHTRRQLESMVFLKWDKDYFRPQWYYILFHNRYRTGPDRRTMLQLVPTAASVEISEEESEKQQEDAETVAHQELMDAVNRQAETHYHLYFKKKFDDLNQEIDNLLVECINENMPTDAVQKLGFEQIRLNDNLHIIREGYLQKGDSAEAMEEIEADLITLKLKITRLLRYIKIQNKFTEK